MAAKKWKQSRDSLFRGDHAETINVPSPTADASVVRHVMFLEGPGRETPYLSTTERREIADRFAKAGAVWETTVAVAKASGVNHISNSELLGLMKGNGKGSAKWPSAFEVMQARRYAEEHSEHLLDFRSVPKPQNVVPEIFKKL